MQAKRIVNYFGKRMSCRACQEWVIAMTIVMLNLGLAA